MFLNQEQIKRLEKVTKCRAPIINASIQNGWANFICNFEGAEYHYRIPIEDKQADYVINENNQINDEELVHQNTSLTPRQWAVYRLIKDNSLVEHRKTSQREIYEKIEGYVWNDNENSHDHCPAIWNDVKDNNLSFEHQHLIISDKFEYWIGSKRECEEFIKKLWGEISSRLHRYWRYVKLLGYDGQGRFYDKNLNPVNGDNAFYKAFNNYDIEMQKEVRKHGIRESK